MIEVNGKQVFTELAELVDPRHAALVVVDMQRDFCKPGGAFERLGVSISMYPEMIPRLAHLVDGARAAKVLVVYLLMTVLPGRASESPAQIRFNMRMHLSQAEGEPIGYTEEGSEGQKLIEELTVEDGDLVVKKYRSSAFWGTNLDMLLRSNGIQTAIVVGLHHRGLRRVDRPRRDVQRLLRRDRGRLRRQRRSRAARRVDAAHAQSLRYSRL